MLDHALPATPDDQAPPFGVRPADALFMPDLRLGGSLAVWALRARGEASRALSDACVIMLGDQGEAALNALRELAGELSASGAKLARHGTLWTTRAETAVLQALDHAAHGERALAAARLARAFSGPVPTGVVAAAIRAADIFARRRMAFLPETGARPATAE